MFAVAGTLLTVEGIHLCIGELRTQVFPVRVISPRVVTLVFWKRFDVLPDGYQILFSCLVPWNMTTR